MEPSKRSISWIQLYLLMGIIQLLSIVLDYVPVHDVTKYLLMPPLAMYVITQMASGAKGKRIILAAVFLSWLGDIFLIYTQRNELYFLLGLGSFLLAHIAYILSFFTLRNPGKSQWILLLLAIPFGIYAAWLLNTLMPSLGDMQVPVIVYGCVITVMGISALLRFGKTFSYSFWFVFIGAVLFIISDSLIAWNMFYKPVQMAGLLIMITYIIAQYLIVSGLLMHNNEAEH